MFEQLKSEWQALVTKFDVMSGKIPPAPGAEQTPVPTLAQLHQDAVTLMGKMHDEMAKLGDDLSVTKSNLVALERRVFGTSQSAQPPAGNPPPTA